MPKHIGRAVTIAVIALLASAPTAGQRAGTLHVGFFGRAASFDESLGLDNGIGAGGRIGFFLIPNLALEGDATIVQTQHVSGLQASYLPFRGRLLFAGHPSRSLGLLVGAGFVHNRYGDEIVGQDTGISGLVGVQVGSGAISLRLEGIGDYMPSPTNANAGTSKNLNLGAHFGLNIAFSLTGGGARPAIAQRPPTDVDRDGVPDDRDRCLGTRAGASVDSVGCPLPVDSDRDGVTDEVDRCSNTPAGTAVDDAGCPLPTDADGDGVVDTFDQCADTPAGQAVSANGCPIPTDDDGDGVPNDRDLCADTPAGAQVTETGCPPPEAAPRDSDGDGVIDDADACPNTATGTAVDSRGCAVPVDTDADGVPDTLDRCADTPAGTTVDETGCQRVETDGDGDGVIDDVDACPNTAPNTAVDGRGCALPLDADGDGVDDRIDICPNTPTASQVDSTGCPLQSVDTDGDGVTDNLDQCPNTPANTSVNSTGCPISIDRDNDGIPDLTDRCPNTPAGSTVDSTGCVPTTTTDEDRDGVPDATDVCPNTVVGAEVDTNGCPLNPPTPSATGPRSVLEGVRFVANSAGITGLVTPILDRLADSLLALPANIRFEIAGHTDDTGDRNALELSQRRADAVREYLVSKGVDPARLTARGYGADDPRADNSTREGRMLNRRVEIRQIQ